MTEYSPRLFASDEEIVELGETWLALRLPRPEWTHEAHLAATTWLLLRRPDIDADAELGGIIRRYNESVGGVNSDTEGYHETITRVFLNGVRLFLAEADATAPLHELVNALLLSPMGHRDWPLRFYSPERLFSVEARRRFVEPDRAVLPLKVTKAMERRVKAVALGDEKPTVPTVRKSRADHGTTRGL